MHQHDVLTWHSLIASRSFGAAISHLSSLCTPARHCPLDQYSSACTTTTIRSAQVGAELISLLKLCKLHANKSTASIMEDDGERKSSESIT
jgi:hypothetical protein